MEAVTLISNALALKTQWIEARDGMLATAAAIATVDNAAALEAAGSLTAQMAKHRRALEAERKAVTDPAREWIDQIMRQEKELAAQLETEHARLKALADGYATREAARVEAARIEAQRRMDEEAAKVRAAEAEDRRKAQAVIDAANAEERQRLAAIERQRQEEAARQREVLAAQQRAAEALKPKPAAPTTTANRMVTRWKFRVVDPCAVPRMYCVPDDSAIRRYMKAATDAGQVPELRGVEFVKTVSVEGRG